MASDSLRSLARQARGEDGRRGLRELAASRVGSRGGVARDGRRGELEDGAGVAGFQRARMIAALVEVIGERGVGDVTVAHIVARSGVSRRTFYELFEDREACFLAAFDEAVRRASTRVLPAFEGAEGWRDRVKAGLTALLAFLEDEPGLGALCVVHALGAGNAALERRAAIVRVLVDVVDEGRAQARRGASPTRLTAEGVVGAVLGVLHVRLTDSQSRQQEGSPAVMELLGPLMGIILLPYLGQAVATREASRPAPAHRRAARSLGDPLRELDMRLTYRTVRVLVAIASAPGVSNRRVADTAGVSDQGQISKLLTRLEHLGLISNQSGGHARGEPNSWTLTAKGQDVARTIHEQTTTTSA